MMENEFVSLEQAKALKDLGFNDKCMAFYNTYDKLVLTQKIKNSYSFGNDKGVTHAHHMAAPTWNQAFKFFRDKGYCAEIHMDVDEEVYFFILIKVSKIRIYKNKPLVTGSGVIHEDFTNRTFEEAQKYALDHLISTCQL